MLSLSKRYAVYIPTSPRPSSKIFDFFGISPSASPTSSLRQLLSRQGTGGWVTPYHAGGPDADRQDVKDNAGEAQGWSNTEAYKAHQEPLHVRCTRCCCHFVWNFGAIWFLIPINAGLIGLLLRQILIHVLIPSDLVHAANTGPLFPIQTKAAVLRTSQSFQGQVTLQTISTVFFFIDLVLFVLFSVLVLLKLICFRQAAWREAVGLDIGRKTSYSTADEAENALNKHSPHSDRTIRKRSKTNPIGDLALWPLAWLTVVVFGVCIIPEMASEPISWNLSYGAYISWWISAAWIILTTVLVLGVLILASPGSSTQLTATGTDRQHWRWKLGSNLLFIPTALSTLSVVGALLVSDLLIQGPSPSDTKTKQSRTTLPDSAILAVLIVSFCTVGASLFLSAILFPAILFTHMLASSISGVESLSQGQYQAPEPARHLDPRGFGLLRTGTPVIIAPPEPNHEEPHEARQHHPHAARKDRRPAKPLRLKRKGIPTTAAIFHLLTTLSLSSAALQLLGNSLSPISPPAGSPSQVQVDRSTGTGNTSSSPGAFLTNTSPSMLSIPCLLLALLLLGTCALFLLLGLVTFLTFAIKKQLRWNMELGHGIVLSFTAMGLSSVVFAASLDSGFFRVVACVFLGLVVVGFVVNLAFTGGFVVSGAYRRV